MSVGYPERPHCPTFAEYLHCLDNAVAERFFRTLKTEWLANWRDMPSENVRRDIVDCIEMFCNSERLHSYTGYPCPNDCEKQKVMLL